MKVTRLSTKKKRTQQRTMEAERKAEPADVILSQELNNEGLQHLLQQSDPNSKPKTSSRKRFDCSYCKRKFVFQTGLARHVAKFHPDHTNLPVSSGQQAEETVLTAQFGIVVKCKDCGEIFANIKRFEAHTVRYNWEFMLANSRNELEQIGTAPFMNTLLITIIQTALVCEFCDACFSDYASLFYHGAHHSPTSGYSCTYCRLNFFTLDAVLEHRAECFSYGLSHGLHLMNVRKVYSCNVCMSQFDTLPELYEHRFTDHHYFPRRDATLSMDAEKLNRMWLYCELCGYTCDHIYTLLNHRGEHHYAPSPGGEANEPEKTPSTKRSAVKRIVEKDDASNYRQFLCDKCGKTYTQSSHLWQHLRFHNGIRPFACSVPGCARRFTIRPDLSDHIRKCHTGERPYECEVCHKRFLTGSVFYQHRLIHRNERRHACKDCDRRFYRADALKNHRRIHTGEKPYACTHCDRKFRQRGDREKHVRVKHLKFH